MCSICGLQMQCGSITKSRHHPGTLPETLSSVKLSKCCSIQHIALLHTTQVHTMGVSSRQSIASHTQRQTYHQHKPTSGGVTNTSTLKYSLRAGSSCHAARQDRWVVHKVRSCQLPLQWHQQEGVCVMVAHSSAMKVGASYTNPEPTLQ